MLTRRNREKAEKRLPRTMEPWQLSGEDGDKMIFTVGTKERAWWGWEGMLLRLCERK